MLLQIYEVIEDSEHSKLMSDKVKKLLTNYLQYLDYVFIKEEEDAEQSPPVVYTYSNDQTVAPYCDSKGVELPPKDFLDEGNDPYVK